MRKFASLKMTQRAYIAFTIVFVLFFTRATAQLGHVVVHADPRLAVLLKKNPAATPLPAKSVDEKSAVKGTAVNGEKAESPEEHRFVPPPPRDGKIIYAGKGFRVQIYNGYDREKAMKVRTEFIRSNTDTKAYLLYAAPFFRVRIGDYRNREQAASKLREVKDNYATPCMVVPDQITIHER